MNNFTPPTRCACREEEQQHLPCLPAAGTYLPTFLGGFCLATCHRPWNTLPAFPHPLPPSLPLIARPAPFGWEIGTFNIPQPPYPRWNRWVEVGRWEVEAFLPFSWRWVGCLPFCISSFLPFLPWGVTVFVFLPYQGTIPTPFYLSIGSGRRNTAHFLTMEVNKISFVCFYHHGQDTNFLLSQTFQDSWCVSCLPPSSPFFFLSFLACLTLTYIVLYPCSSPSFPLPLPPLPLVSPWPPCTSPLEVGQVPHLPCAARFALDRWRQWNLLTCNPYPLPFPLIPMGTDMPCLPFPYPLPHLPGTWNRHGGRIRNLHLPPSCNTVPWVEFPALGDCLYLLTLPPKHLHAHVSTPFLSPCHHSIFHSFSGGHCLSLILGEQ